MAGTIWIPGAERLKASAPGGTITSTAPPRVVWHTVEAPAGKDATFQSMINVLTGKGAEPQVLYDPVTDRLGQFFGLDLSGRALKNDGTTRTNRTGRVCIQIEVMGYSAHPFTDTWTPGPNFRALMAAIRSWGIPDVWPSGNPPKYVDGRGNVPEDERSRTIWLSKAGHYGHSQVPANSHGDPGGIDVAKLFAAGKPKSTTPDVTPVTTPPKGTPAVATPDPDIYAAHVHAKSAAVQTEALLSRLALAVPVRPAVTGTGDAFGAHYWAKRTAELLPLVAAELARLGYPKKV